MVWQYKNNDYVQAEEQHAKKVLSNNLGLEDFAVS